MKIETDLLVSEVKRDSVYGTGVSFVIVKQRSDGGAAYPGTVQLTNLALDVHRFFTEALQRRMLGRLTVSFDDLPDTPDDPRRAKLAAAFRNAGGSALTPIQLADVALEALK